ncbi:hypothetical protein [Sphingomonas sp. ERG5]|uniref:hypothetical protein n=1 Tax=Sphingomonas sp. ERG5 TaxID=1381597 RepID=UPI001364BC52|nr:hypothetical protein [Sphingomonas sp. ERG5]
MAIDINVTPINTPTGINLPEKRFGISTPGAGNSQKWSVTSAKTLCNDYAYFHIWCNDVLRSRIKQMARR